MRPCDEADLERAAARSVRRPPSTAARSHVSRPVTEGADELVAAVQALGDAGIALDDISLRRPTLDDVFLTLTGHSDRGRATTESDDEEATP